MTDPDTRQLLALLGRIADSLDEISASLIALDRRDSTRGWSS